jgi:hypothetical protein
VRLAAASGVLLYLCGTAELALLGSMLSVRDVRTLEAPPAAVSSE